MMMRFLLVGAVEQVPTAKQLLRRVGFFWLVADVCVFICWFGCSVGDLLLVLDAVAVDGVA